MHWATARATAQLACVLTLACWPAAGALSAQGAEDAGGSMPPSEAASARRFESEIAPLLAHHCLECHGWRSTKGRLDLSRKASALAGGESGRAITPGQAAESLLWQYVESDQMPKGRTPLSPQEKQSLRQWIDAGAVWSSEAIGPAAYAAVRGTGESRLRRLTLPEYIETVRSAVGVDIDEEARRYLPPDVRADGFSNTAYSLGIDLAHVEAYARLAAIVAGRMDVVQFAAQFSQRRNLSDASMREVISEMGKWLLRGPLEEHEIAAFLRVSSAVAEQGGDFAEAVRYVVEAMLQSPRFIYRLESQIGDGAPRRVGDYELASRLSYILWGGPPDKELMRAADAGELSDRSRVEAQVQRMLQDPRVIEQSARFIHEWMDLDRLNHLRPDPDRFPMWTARLASDMREETVAFFKHVAWEQKRPLADLLNARVTFATPRLAHHYGLVPRDAAAAEGRGRPRVSSGLQALYTFEEGSGNTVRDVSGAGEPIHLTIADVAAVHWGEQGLAVQAPTLIAAAQPPQRLIDAVKKSQAIALEAWISPGDTRQSGPARILTLSSDTNRRNFTLGQDADKYDVRFRASATDANGLPSLSTPSGAVETRPSHVVYTRDVDGKAKLYVDGSEQAAGNIVGDVANWDAGFRLAMANEVTRDRPWLGTLHLVAIYSRALTPEEVQANGEIGSTGAGLARYDLASVPGRGGLLTQGSVLTIGGDEASMVARGLFILHELLYSGVEDPPPCVDTSPVPTKPGLTQRAIAENRLASASCRGCHARFEPLAFGLEKFDGLGAYRDVDEHGNQLREDGEILFPDQDRPVSYSSTAELMDLLAGSERVRRGITRKVTQFALGRPLTDSDEPVLDEIHRSAQAGGGTYASLITAIVMSDLVQLKRTETNP